MRRFTCHVACAALAACVVAGCGSSQTGGTATPAGAHAVASAPPHATSDPQRARVGLLPRAQIPLHVGEVQSKRNRARCGPRALFGRVATGIATSPRYGVEGGQVQQSVLLFGDARRAARAFAQLTSRANDRCLRQAARDEVSVESRSADGPVEELTINLEPRGQQAAAYRMRTLVYSAGSEVSIDILINRIGRSLSSVSVIWTQPPSTLDFDEALVTRIAARLQQLLA